MKIHVRITKDDGEVLFEVEDDAFLPLGWWNQEAPFDDAGRQMTGFKYYPSPAARWFPGADPDDQQAGGLTPSTDQLARRAGYLVHGLLHAISADDKLYKAARGAASHLRVPFDRLTLGQLASVPRWRFLEFDGVGNATLDHIETFLHCYGFMLGGQRQVRG